MVNVPTPQTYPNVCHLKCVLICLVLVFCRELIYITCRVKRNLTDVADKYSVHVMCNDSAKVI